MRADRVSASEVGRPCGVEHHLFLALAHHLEGFAAPRVRALGAGERQCRLVERRCGCRSAASPDSSSRATLPHGVGWRGICAKMALAVRADRSRIATIIIISCCARGGRPAAASVITAALRLTNNHARARRRSARAWPGRRGVAAGGATRNASAAV